MPRPVRISPLPIGLGDTRGSQPYALGRGLEHRNRPCPLESAVIVGARGEELHPERDGIGAGRGSKFVDERFGREGDLRAVGISEVAGPQGRLPHERQADDVGGHAATGDDVHIRRRRGPAAVGRRAPQTRELGDEDGVVLVVAEVVVIGRARFEIVGDEVPLGVEAAAHGDGVSWRFGVPGGLFVAHPLQPHGPSDLLGQERCLKPRVVGGGAAIGLRPFHPHHPDTIAWHLEELSHAVPQSVRLHVVRIDGQLVVRRIGDRMRWPERRVPLKGHLVLGFDHLRCALERRVGRAGNGRLRAEGWRGAADVVEQLLGRREGRTGGALPRGLELPGRLNGLLFALADDRQVVSAPYDRDEARQAADRGFVHARERGPGERRLHVARMHHAGQLHIDRPPLRPVHLWRNVVARQRLSGQPEVLDVLDAGHTGRGVDVVARQRDVESTAADELTVGHLSRRDPRSPRRRRHAPSARKPGH